MGNFVSQTDTQSSLILKLYKLSQQDLNLLSTKIKYSQLMMKKIWCNYLKSISSKPLSQI